jgi:hypothetical protein
MADIHAMDYDTDGEGNLIPPAMGTQETRDFVLACVLGTLGFSMRGYQPVAVLFNAENIAKTIMQPGKGNLTLCRVTFYFFFEGPNHSVYGKLTFDRVVAAYILARLLQRKRRGESTMELEGALARALKAKERYQIHDWMLYEVAQLIDMASNLFVISETVKGVAEDPMLAIVRALSKPGGLAHVAQPLNSENSVFAKKQFYEKR